MKTLLFIDNTAHHLYTQSHLYNYFRNVTRYKIILCAPDDGNYFSKLQNSGYECIHCKIDGKSLNPLNNLILLVKLWFIISCFKPDVVLTFTIKPNLFVALLSRLFKIKVVPNITGVGSAMLTGGFLRKMILWFYQIAFEKLQHVTLQNKDDYQLLLNNKVFAANTLLHLIPGSGVNTEYFLPITVLHKQYSHANEIVFLYSGRMLWDKGLGELIAAFKLVKQQYTNTKLLLIGNFFKLNPSAITEEEIAKWCKFPGVEYLGMLEDVRPVIAESDCMVLPSYREGMPRVILEASSMGKFVIATDVPGCRDAIDDNVTGFLCKVKNTNDLVQKMLQFVALDGIKREEIGSAGRRKMQREFEQSIVINTYNAVVKDLLES